MSNEARWYHKAQAEAEVARGRYGEIQELKGRLVALQALANEAAAWRKRYGMYNRFTGRSVGGSRRSRLHPHVGKG